MSIYKPPNLNGHGWVVPRPDGTKARCGGPALCSVCAAEQAATKGEPPHQGSAGRRPRDDKDYAIEFGEYLAKAAKRFMDAHNAQHAAQMLSDFGAATAAEQDVTEAWRGLEDAIYEYRKRAARAGHEPSAIEFAK